MFLELKSSLRASFLDLGTDPHLFFETPGKVLGVGIQQ